MGYDEVLDNFKLKDAKGNCVLCYKCGKSSIGHREIIACDFCTLRWHLDCLDPPLANPPVRGDSSKPKSTWMCPNHIDQDMSAIKSDTKATDVPKIGTERVHRIRRPGNARIVDTALRRGFRNNGIIEIENELTDDEEEFEREEFGVIYRLPERGIKLDFIDRIKGYSSTSNDRDYLSNTNAWFTRSQREALHHQQQSVRAREQRKRRIVAAARARQAAFDKRPLAERQAAFNLARFARSNQDIAIRPDQVTNLINTLIVCLPVLTIIKASQYHHQMNTGHSTNLVSI